MNKKIHVCNLSMITLVIVGIVLMAYGVKGIYPFGKTSLAWQDMSQVTIPLYYYWYDVLHGDAAPFFSWVGTGLNMTGIASEMSLLSPLNLALLFSTRENIYNFVSILLLLKMVAMAWSMYIFANRYKIDNFYKIMISILYGCCSCVLIHYQIGFMIDIAIFFPIVIMGMYRLLDDGKHWIFLFSLALCLTINIYISVMVVIYLFTMSGIYLHFCVPHKDRPLRVRLLGFSTVVAALIGAFAWYPALTCILNSGRMTNAGASDLVNQYFSILLSDQKDNFLIHFLFINTSFLVGIILIDLIKNRKSKGVLAYHRWKTIILVLSVIVPSIELFWHTGTRASFPVRFAFMVTFALAEYCMVCIERNKVNAKEKRLNILVDFLWIIGLIGIIQLLSSGIVGVSKSAYNLIYITVCVEVLLVSIFYIVYTKYGGTLKKHIVSSFIILEISFNCFVWFSPSLLVSESEAKRSDMLYELSTQIDGSKYEGGHVKDYEGKFNSNYAFVLGKSSISNYVHIIKGELQTLLSRLGYSTTWTRLLDTGGTVFSDALLGIDEVVSTTELYSEIYTENETVGNKDVIWYDSAFVMPKAVEVKKSIIFDGNKYNYQNDIFAEVSGRTEELIQEYAISGKSVDIEINDKKLLYFYSDNDESISIKVNGRHVNVPNYLVDESIIYPVPFNNGIISLGMFCNENINVSFDVNDGYDLSKIHLGLLDIDLLENALNELNDEYSSLKYSSQKASVNIEWISDEGNLLFLPICYDDGWSCRINGTKKQLAVLFDGYIGVPLEKGENSIVLQYCPEGLKTAIVLSVMGLLISALWLFCIGRWGVFSVDLFDKCIKAIYDIFWLVFMIFFYGCPFIVFIYRIVIRIMWNM